MPNSEDDPGKKHTESKVLTDELAERLVKITDSLLNRTLISNLISSNNQLNDNELRWHKELSSLSQKEKSQIINTLNSLKRSRLSLSNVGDLRDLCDDPKVTSITNIGKERLTFIKQLFPSQKKR